MNAQPISILVIDEDPGSLRYIRSFLEQHGYSVFTASQGRDGLISAWKDLPEIIIFDPAISDIPPLELLKRLHQDRRTASVPCIALSGQQDQSEMDALIQAGCREYLVKSSQALPYLLELIPRLLTKKPAEAGKLGYLVVFLSAKGGAGTSSLCANIAMCQGAEPTENRVAILDLVLPIGSIAEIVGYEDRLNIVSIAAQEAAQTTPSFFKDTLPMIPGWFVHLVAGSPDPKSANLLKVDRLEDILHALLASHDFVFVDVGRALSRISLPMLHKADAIVLVVGSDISSAILTRKVCDFIFAQGIHPKKIYPLQNRAIGLEGLTKTEFEKETGIQIRLTMPYMSGNFTLANNRHEPVITKFPNDSSALTLLQASTQIREMCQNSHRTGGNT